MNELVIYGDIGESFWGDSVTAADVKSMLDGMSGDITVRINSPGGSVFDGFAIYNLLRAHNGSVTVHVDGLAASAASVVAMAGDDVVMGAASMMMIHDPWTMSVGDASEMRKTAETLDKIRDSIVDAYASKAADMDRDEIAKMMAEETWMTASEAQGFGFANKLEESEATISNLSRPWINSAPSQDKIPDSPEANTAWRVALQSRKLALKTK
jgi:ATP-dependent Clp endopeptidase proteolytic subunit ClpP